MTPEFICDFCSEKPVVASYAADDFEATPFSVPGASLYQTSVGGWAACATCEKLIDANDWDRLLDRAVTTFFLKHPALLGMFSRERLREHLADLYDILRTKNFRKVKL